MKVDPYTAVPGPLTSWELGNSTDVVHFLRAGANVNAKDPANRTALHFAGAHRFLSLEQSTDHTWLGMLGHREMFVALREAGADQYAKESVSVLLRTV